MTDLSPGAGSATRVGTSNDVFPFYPVWLSETELLYTADGKIQIGTVGGGTTDVPFEATFPITRDSYSRKRFDFDSSDKRQVVGIVGPALSPDAKRVAFEALNQIWLMEIGKKPHPITADAYYKCDPAWSSDGSKIAYSTDKSGIMKVYVYDVRTGRGDDAPVTDSGGAQVSPAWSRDGSKLAFQDQNGATFYYDFNTRAVHAVGAPPAGSTTLNLFAPSKPSWSYAGNTIAIGALKPYTRRFREGTSQILTVDVKTGALAYNPTGNNSGEGQYMSLSTRGEDGPVYSPDGTAMALVMESNLWIRPVDRASGLPTGAAVRINTEVTDAPTWSGDSQQLRRAVRCGRELDHEQCDETHTGNEKDVCASPHPAERRDGTRRAGRPHLAAGPAFRPDRSPRRAPLGRARARRAEECRHHHPGQPHREHPAAPTGLAQERRQRPGHRRLEPDGHSRPLGVAHAPVHRGEVLWRPPRPPVDDLWRNDPELGGRSGIPRGGDAGILRLRRPRGPSVLRDRRGDRRRARLLQLHAPDYERRAAGTGAVARKGAGLRHGEDVRAPAA